MISNILILIILLYLAIRLLALILLILRRLNRSQDLAQNQALQNSSGILFPTAMLQPRHDVAKFAKLK